MNTIVAYHRPSDLDEAVTLLERTDVTTTVVAGGTALYAAGLPENTEVVDIQDAVPATVESQGARVVFGAMARLTDLIEHEATPPLLVELARREGPNTLRNASTIGGTVAEGDAESELLAGLLVHEATISLSNGTENLPLGTLFADWSVLDRAVITSVSVAIGGATASARTGRTPADTSIVAAAARIVPNAILVALTGVAPTPVLVNPDQISTLTPPADFRGSSEYRTELAGVMTERVVSELGGAS